MWSRPPPQKPAAHCSIVATALEDGNPILHFPQRRRNDHDSMRQMRLNGVRFMKGAIRWLIRSAPRSRRRATLRGGLSVTPAQVTPLATGSGFARGPRCCDGPKQLTTRSEVADPFHFLKPRIKSAQQARGSRISSDAIPTLKAFSCESNVGFPTELYCVSRGCETLLPCRPFCEGGDT
jgi:hypothetical protein